MPHNFDLSAYITKNPDDNKLVIQIKITDMAHNHSSNWGNGNSQKTELTWEEQNFMEEQEEGQQAKPDFSEYSQFWVEKSRVLWKNANFFTFLRGAMPFP